MTWIPIRAASRYLSMDVCVEMWTRICTGMFADMGIGMFTNMCGMQVHMLCTCRACTHVHTYAQPQVVAAASLYTLLNGCLHTRARAYHSSGPLENEHPTRMRIHMSKHMSKHMSEHRSKHMSEHMSEHMSIGHMFRHVFKHMSKHRF